MNTPLHFSGAGLRLAALLTGLAALAGGLGPRGCQRPGLALPLTTRLASPRAALPSYRPLAPRGTGAPAWEVARVTRIVDGDTYAVLTGGQLVRLRLLGVDAPEHDQAFGRQATDSVRALLLGQLVALQRRGLDLYGRTLGVVQLLAPNPDGGPARPGLALDSLLVVRGWAWAWDPTRAVAGRAAQQLLAQRAGRGLWQCGTEAPVPPKLWRGFTATIKRRYAGGCTW